MGSQLATQNQPSYESRRKIDPRGSSNGMQPGQQQQNRNGQSADFECHEESEVIVEQQRPRSNQLPIVEYDVGSDMSDLKSSTGQLAIVAYHEKSEISQRWTAAEDSWRKEELMEATLPLPFPLSISSSTSILESKDEERGQANKKAKRSPHFASEENKFVDHDDSNHKVNSNEEKLGETIIEDKQKNSTSTPHFSPTLIPPPLVPLASSLTPLLISSSLSQTSLAYLLPCKSSSFGSLPIKDENHTEANNAYPPDISLCKQQEGKSTEEKQEEMEEEEGIVSPLKHEGNGEESAQKEEQNEEQAVPPLDDKETKGTKGEGQVVAFSDRQKDEKKENLQEETEEGEDDEDFEYGGDYGYFDPENSFFEWEFSQSRKRDAYWDSKRCAGENLYGVRCAIHAETANQKNASPTWRKNARPLLTGNYCAHHSSQDPNRRLGSSCGDGGSDSGRSGYPNKCKTPTPAPHSFTSTSIPLNPTPQKNDNRALSPITNSNNISLGPKNTTITTTTTTGEISNSPNASSATAAAIAAVTNARSFWRSMPLPHLSVPDVLAKAKAAGHERAALRRLNLCSQTGMPTTPHSPSSSASMITANTSAVDVISPVANMPSSRLPAGLPRVPASHVPPHLAHSPPSSQNSVPCSIGPSGGSSTSPPPPMANHAVDVHLAPCTAKGDECAPCHSSSNGSRGRKTRTSGGHGSGRSRRRSNSSSIGGGVGWRSGSSGSGRNSSSKKNGDPGRKSRRNSGSRSTGGSPHRRSRRSRSVRRSRSRNRKSSRKCHKHGCRERRSRSHHSSNCRKRETSQRRRSKSNGSSSEGSRKQSKLLLAALLADVDAMSKFVEHPMMKAAIDRQVALRLAPSQRANTEGPSPSTASPEHTLISLPQVSETSHSASASPSPCPISCFVSHATRVSSCSSPVLSAALSQPSTAFCRVIGSSSGSPFSASQPSPQRSRFPLSQPSSSQCPLSLTMSPFSSSQAEFSSSPPVRHCKGTTNGKPCKISTRTSQFLVQNPLAEFCMQHHQQHHI